MAAVSGRLRWELGSHNDEHDTIGRARMERDKKRVRWARMGQDVSVTGQVRKRAGEAGSSPPKTQLSIWCAQGSV